MPARGKLQELLLPLYEAAERPDCWKQFLDDLQQSTNAQGACLLTHDLRTSAARGLLAGPEPAEVELYFKHYCFMNPWLPRRPADIQGGPVLISDAFPLSQFRKTEFYNDWGRRNHVVHSIATSLHLDDDRFVYLCLNRGERAGQHPKAALDLMSALAPHVKSAWRIHELLRLHEDWHTGLNWLSTAMFLVSGGGRVLDLTEPARELVDAKDGLTLDSRHSLRALHHGDREALAALLQRTSRSPLKAPGMMKIRRAPLCPFPSASPTDSPGDLPPSFRREHILIALPVRRHTPLGAAQARVIVIVIRPDLPPGEFLKTAGRALYHLSTAEIRLVVALVQHGSLEKAIGQLGITRNTARTQMAAIFTKTGTNRQGELIKLFTTLSDVTHMGDDF